MAGQDATEFCILGPFEVRENGRSLDVGAGKQRALLALLLLNVGEAVSTDRVIDALWGERPPASALNSVRVYVSHLRKALGNERLRTRGRGYLLTVEPDELDLARFERQAAEGREALAAGDAELAARLLRTALALWRGAPLEDFASEPFAQTEIARLEELRLIALEERVEADLALGRHAELVPELEALVRENPLRERLRAQLMLAFYRSGRQAEALEEYRRWRATLVEELGIEPSRRLQTLERAILSQDPQLDPPARAAAPLLRTRRRGGLLIAIGAGLLLAAAIGVVIIEVTHNGSAGLASASANAVALVDADTNQLVADVPVGSGPTSVAFGAGSFWVTNAEDNSVVRFDPDTRRVIERIPVGSQPSGIAFYAGDMWVANHLDGTVSRIDPQTNAVVQPIDVGVTPTAVAGGLGSVWVTSADAHSVTKIDAVTGHVVDTIPTGAVGRGIAVGADSVWITDEASGSIVRIDQMRGRVVRRVNVGTGPTGIAFEAGSVWVANSLSGTVSRIDPETNEVTATIQVGEGPDAVAAGPRSVWVSVEFAKVVVRIDQGTDRVVERIPIGNRPKGLAIGRDEVGFAVQPSGAGHRGGRLVIATTQPVPSIDPALGLPGGITEAYDGLVRAARRGGSTGTQVVPNLAVALPEVTAAGTEYTFRLRRGIRYSDGRVVKASDFRRALERMFRARSGISISFGSVVGADVCFTRPVRCSLSRGVPADDATGTIVFRLRRPDAEFLASLAAVVPVPPGTPKTDVGTHRVPSTGPYMIERYVPRRFLRLVRNPHFRVWSHLARPDGFPDEIDLRLMDEDQAVTAVERGQADFAWVSPDRLEEVQSRYASQLHLNPAPGTMFFVFLNTRLPPFDDVRVRRAVNYAVDRDAVARVVGGPELAQPLCQIRPPSVAGYVPYCPYTVNPSLAGEWKAPDLARARRLVAASGTRGMKLTMWTWTVQIEPAAREVAATLEKLGYRTSLKRVDSINRYFPKVLDAKTRAQAGMFGWIGASGLLPSYVLPYLTCGAIRPPPQNNNPGFFCDPRIDALIRRALTVQATDPDTAVALWPRIERELVDLAPWVPLFTRKDAHIVSKRVGNYQYSPASGVLIEQLWVR